LNTTIIETAAAQGWLTGDQISLAQQAIENNPSISVLEFFAQQGWLESDHISWLQQTVMGAMSVVTPESPGMSDGEEAVALGDAPNIQFSPTESVPCPPGLEPSAVAPDGALTHVNEYLKIGQLLEASDVHLGVGSPPIVRRYGMLQPMWEGAPLLEATQTKRLLFEFLAEPQKEVLQQRGDVDFCYEVPEMGRFRTSVVRQRIGYDGVFRIINTRVRTMDELALNPILKGLTKFHNGLILVTGSVGSGKSTTLAALVEEVNRDRHDHIITLEDPIEYVFKPHGCQITQREVHTHTESFAAALRGALREDPDVIMVGEMRDLETIQLAITASETGHLVLGTLHTSNAARTLDRLLDVFPYEQQAQIRTMVAGSLRGILSQQLLPRADGTGRVMAMEVLINTPAAAALIRDGKTFMLPGVIQTGRKIGCKLMDDALLEMLEKGIIRPEDAYERCEQKTLFRSYLPKK
jgi:twitching motility protein PilT